MRNIQEYFNETHKGDAWQIFISDIDLEKTIGTQLIIKDYHNLKNIYISIEQLEYIKIENCEKLEQITIYGPEIELTGEYKRLKSIKTRGKAQQPVIIKQEEAWLCWKCISIFIFFTILFTILVSYFNKKINRFINYHKKTCGKNGKAKKPKNYLY